MLPTDRIAPLRRYRTRIAALLVGVVVVAQAATMVAVLDSTEADVHARIDAELDVGARVFDRLLETRFEQALQTASVLASDFGFKAAVTTGDAATIRSALTNHGRRAGADLLTLLDLEGRTVAEVLDGEPHLPARARYPESLVEVARARGSAGAVVIVGDRPFQAVLVPVNAPTRVAWAMIGFAIDDGLARQLGSLTALEISFVTRSETSPPFVSSTLDRARRYRLRDAVAGLPAADGAPVELALGPDAPYLTRFRELDAPGGRVVAVLQSSLVEALAPYRALRKELLLLGLLASLAAMAISIPMSNGITAPIRQLAAAAARIGSGDYSTEVGLRSRDELGLLAGVFNDMQRGISEREAKIVHQAHYDGLTGLPNRTLALDRLSTAIERAAREHYRVAVVAVGFTNLEDLGASLGQATVDAALLEAAERFRQRMRSADTVAVIGDHQFLLLMEKMDADDARRFSDGIEGLLDGAIELGEARISLRSTAGVAMYPENGGDAEILTRRATLAMHDAERSHARVATYEAGRDEGQLRRLAVVGDLERAVRESELELYFQPKIALPGRRLVEVEALVRWFHPVHGFIAPDEFIPLAEQAGNIPLLTDWVLRTAVRTCRAWADEGLDLEIGVNVSPIDLRDSGLPSRVASILADHRVDPRSLHVEVTESAIMRDGDSAIAVLRELSASGVRVAIDDYGTGYSSLAKIKALPVDELKIDKSFVLSIESEPDDAVIVRSTIELGHSMGLTVTAEGVESEAACALLADYGCDVLQGYHFSRPVPASELAAWARSYVDGEGAPDVARLKAG